MKSVCWGLTSGAYFPSGRSHQRGVKPEQFFNDTPLTLALKLLIKSQATEMHLRKAVPLSLQLLSWKEAIGSK